MALPTAVLTTIAALTLAAPVLAQQSTEVGRVNGREGERVTVTTYAGGDIAPERRIQTRSTSGDRERALDVVEVPDVDGRYRPFQEISTETVRSAGGVVETRDVFGFPLNRRQLVETTRSERTSPSTANTRTVQSTWVPRPNGALDLVSRTEEETSVAPDETRTTVLVLEPGINEPLRETTRIEHVERRGPTGTRYDRVERTRDVNGTWQVAATWSGETRDNGPLNSVHEETIQHRDINGHVTTTERVVTTHDETNGRTLDVVETYSLDRAGWGQDGHLGLSQRVRRTTTAAADGGSSSVEEVEGYSRVAPGDPIRMVRRTTTTVRRIGPERWAFERQVFELDPNGRMALVESSVQERKEQ